MHDEDPPYLDPELPVERRVSDLLDRMTVAEKAGQLTGVWGGMLFEDFDRDDLRAAVVEHGLGAMAPFGWAGALATEPREAAEVVNEVQRAAREETRLGIPLLCNADAVHGHAYVAGTTILPNGLGAAATWDPETVEAGAAVTATELAATGGSQTYSPTCDVCRDPRWGRVFETFGESPRLVAEMAAAKVRGYQGEDLGADGSVVATGKHFPAYGDPPRGEDTAPVEVSEFALRNTFVPPFEAAVDAGLESVMPCYNAVNGRPVHASARFLRDELRGDLGFDGTVVSDWAGVRQLYQDHKTSGDRREAVHDARQAGVDIASVGGPGHADHLVELVESGDLPERVVDESVRRVLEVKFRLGLFEDPFVDPDEAVETVGSDAHQAVALEAARESMTLLSNDGVLPLSGDEDVFVGGPTADSLVDQVGGWSVFEADQVAGTTVLAELRERVDSVTYEQGAGTTERLDIDRAAEAAADADVAVLVLGEQWYIHEFGAGPETTTGEFPTREQLRLPEAQRDLVDAVAGTGTPVVGVLVTGRPLAVPDLDEQAGALLMAYFPGTRGGQAVAETLVGANEPAGRLPMTMLRSAGQVGQVHDHSAHPTPIGEDEHPPSYDPLYEFGHGLSYTEFAYEDVRLAAETVGPGGVVDLDVTVSNVGDRAGSDVVQVYSASEDSSLVRPERRLEAFERVELDAGESATVTVSFPAERLGQYAPGEGHRVEAGDYDLHVAGETATVTVDGAYL